MLVGNFDEPYLYHALKSINWVDEVVIIYNNASKENIQRINDWRIGYNGQFTSADYYKVYREFNFADARNLAKEVSSSDYLLKIDADELYYNSFETTIRSLSFDMDMYLVYFYHLFYSMEHYRFIEPKEVLFANKPEIRWDYKVHERIIGVKSYDQLDDCFIHYGYLKSNEAILDKWRLYAKLEGEPDRYDNIDVTTIIDGVEVKPFNKSHPEALQIKYV